MDTYSQYIGKAAEAIALEKIKSRGLAILTTRYTCRAGELDIVAFDRVEEMLIFIEVKARDAVSPISPEAAITEKKKARILLAASHFLAFQPVPRFRSLRFDVIAIRLQNQAPVAISWLENVFYS